MMVGAAAGEDRCKMEGVVLGGVESNVKLGGGAEELLIRSSGSPSGASVLEICSGEYGAGGGLGSRTRPVSWGQHRYVQRAPKRNECNDT